MKYFAEILLTVKKYIKNRNTYSNLNQVLGLLLYKEFKQNST